MITKRSDYYHEFYNKESSYWASVYQGEQSELSIYAVHFRQRRGVILDMIERLPRASGKALDAGCGPGAYLAPLLAMGYEVSAVDQSEKMVDEARNNFDPAYTDRVTLKVSSLESLPFDSRTFDLATNVAVLMYVENDSKAISELYRVLKPGGSLIITVDNRKDLADSLDFPMRLRRLWRRLTRHRGTPGPSQAGGASANARLYSPNELKRLLIQAGFVLDEETSLGFAPFLFNGKRFLSDKMDRRLDRGLQFLRWLPGVRTMGYTYICRCHRS